MKRFLGSELYEVSTERTRVITELITTFVRADCPDTAHEKAFDHIERGEGTILKELSDEVTFDNDHIQFISKAPAYADHYD